MSCMKHGRLQLIKILHLISLLAFGFAGNISAFAQHSDLIETALSPEKLQDGWLVNDVGFAKLDDSAMRLLTHEIAAGEFNDIHSVLITHRDHLIYEYYKTGKLGNPENKRNLAREELHVLNSITKSVTSLILGIALESEFEQSLSRPVLSYFPGREHPDSRISDITLEHVLSMTAGFLWNEMDVRYMDHTNDDGQLQRSKDPIDYILSRPIRDTPGTYWYYNGGLTMVIAGVIDSLIEQSFFDYSKQVLFEPLNIDKLIWSGAWPVNRLVNAAWGLRLRARDLAKIGTLVLNQGQWRDEQIVPQQWVELSTRRLREDLRTWGGDGVYGYGYQWWHGQHHGNGVEFDAITAMGYGGQRIFILPELELVVTVFAGNYEGDWLKPEAILKRIVSAIR